MIDWPGIFAELNRVKEGAASPSVTLIGEEEQNPYRILVSTVISLRTKDEVTLTASRRLFEKAPDLPSLGRLSEEEIASLIYPCGFYRVKGGNLKKIALTLLEERGGRIPGELGELLKLPGVGLKTANLVLSLGFGVPAICVDIHVHRIANRMGWIATAKPDDSVGALEKVLPREYWIPVNGLLVSYGQQICTPQSPRCSLCGFAAFCPKAGVERSR